jgi:hypothetical protein
MENEKIRALKKIVEEVCGVNLDIKTRKREYINGRAICYKILRDVEFLSYHAIGRAFNKSHSTILLCLRDFKYMLLSDGQMKRNYHGILALWEGMSEEYKEIKPIEIKKQLKYLEEQNKLLNLSLTDVQEKYDKRLKEFEERLEKIKMISTEPYI